MFLHDLKIMIEKQCITIKENLARGCVLSPVITATSREIFIQVRLHTVCSGQSAFEKVVL